MKQAKGFSLLEILIAMTITVGIGMIVFQLFQQNEAVFRDQNLVIEAQQSARVVAAQIADEIRMAGQGVPVFASGYDLAASEGVAVFLSGSTNNRVQFRGGLSNIESYVASAPPLNLILGNPNTIGVNDASLFSSALGTTSPTGKYIYVWGQTSNEAWTWVRGQLAAISTAANTLTVTPSEGGGSGRSAGADGTLNTGDDVIQFTKPPFVTLEEAVAFYIDSATIKRATASSMTTQTSPSWSAGNDIGRNFTSLEFTYYDEDDNVVAPDSLANRTSISRVDVKVVVETSGELTTGSRNSYALFLRTIPRNVLYR